MNQTAIFWPMIAHVVLIFAMYGVLRIRRRAAVVGGEARMRQFELRGNEPAGSAAVSNNIMNQFELPVLFHVVCICLYVTNGSNLFTVGLAWLFAISRYGHAFIHVTSNRVAHRFIGFFAGFIALTLLWAWFALHIAGIV